MATLRQYFETDFSNTLRVWVAFDTSVGNIDGVLHFDLLAHAAFLSVYVTGENRSYDDLSEIVRTIEHGELQLGVDGRIVLPEIRLFPGDLRIRKEPEVFVEYRLYGDATWRSTKAITATTRIFMYSESDLDPDQVTRLQEDAEGQGKLLQFRGAEYQRERSLREEPLAFLCHDSRDKEDVARPIAVALQRMLCPVWYDEFSLQVGANLRVAIESGLKACRRCILVLSPAFFSNDGWTRKEFDSIFTREVQEGADLVLPVWHGVTKEEVYDYCPSLANIKGLDFSALGLEEVTRQLYKAITPH